MLAFRALTEINTGDGSHFSFGQIVPGAGQWPSLRAELRLQRVEAVDVSDDGGVTDVPYIVRRDFDGHKRGDIVTGLQGHPQYGLMRKSGVLEPVLDVVVKAQEPIKIEAKTEASTVGWTKRKQR